jgi:Zn-dependent protease with chaperone function
MSNTGPTKLNQLRQKAGDRYTPLVYYQTVCHVMAIITLVLGILGFVVSVFAAINTEQWLLVFSGLIILVGGVWGYFMLKVIANLILAVVDVAVNSHLQVYLLSEKD